MPLLRSLRVSTASGVGIPLPDPTATALTSRLVQPTELFYCYLPAASAPVCERRGVQAASAARALSLALATTATLGSRAAAAARWSAPAFSERGIIDECCDCSSVFTSLGFPPDHNVSVLADVLQGVAEKISALNEQRMVLAVVCGPLTGLGGFLLHGTGAAQCTSDPAMEAIARSCNGVVQALQLVATADQVAEPPPLKDDDLLPGDTFFSRSSPPLAPGLIDPDRRPGGARLATTFSPSPYATPRTPAPADGLLRASGAELAARASPAVTVNRSGGSSVSGRPHGGAGSARPSPSPVGAIPASPLAFPALIPWLTKLPERVKLPVSVNGVFKDLPEAKAKLYKISDEVVQHMTGALKAPNVKRGSGMKKRFSEFMTLYSYNVKNRTSVISTFENITPEVARNATITWPRSKQSQKDETTFDPRITNSVTLRVAPNFSIILLMVQLKDPAFLSLLRHFKRPGARSASDRQRDGQTESHGQHAQGEPLSVS